MRFGKRSHLHNIKVQGEIANADAEAATSYSEDLAKILNDGGYLNNRFSVRQNSIIWKQMPSRTFIATDKKSVPGFKASKDKLALLLKANGADTSKLKPMLIYHSPKF